jgi:hypothetical protein
VSPALINELERYKRGVQRELTNADIAYQRAALWQQWAEPKRRAPRLKWVIPFVSGLTLLVCIALPISQSLGLPPDQVGAVLGPLLVLPGIFAFGFVVWQYSGARGSAKRAVAGRIAVACPNCGAMGELVAGAPSQVCAYCRAALIASPPVIARGIDNAELAHRRARLEEFRQERLGMVGISRYDMTAYAPYLVGGSLALTVGGGAITFTIAMLTGDEPYSPAIFGIWALFLAIVAVPVGIVWRRRSRQAAFARVIADLAHQFPTQPLADLPAVVDWLNRYWPAKYDAAHLSKGAYFVAASLEVLGYPALLHCDFTRSEHRKRRLHLLVATQGAPMSLDAAALAHCRHLGFDVSHSDAGLFAAARDETIAIIARSPHALHQIAPAVTAMATAARASGAVPATAV